MNKIWAKQLVLGDKLWSNVPAFRKPVIKVLLQEMVDSGEITEEQYNSIIGETADT